jgi:lipoprotein-anchoring transpeptidase ErfK/SrfK
MPTRSTKAGCAEPLRPSARVILVCMRRLLIAPVAAAAVLVVTACQPTLELTAADLPDASIAQIGLVEAITKNAPIDRPIVVHVDHGRLTDVEVTQGPSRVIKGEFSNDGRTWTSTRAYLDFDSTYSISATAVDPRGQTTTLEEKIRTVDPDGFLTATPSMEAGSEFGVGMPLTVNFDEAVKDRAAVEEAMIVRTPTPVEGAWYWTGPTQAIYRPKNYWPGNIDIELDLDLRGVEASPGLWGESNSRTLYRTTDSVVMEADAQTLMMKVFINGKKERTIPVTMGMDGYETLSGTKLIMTKERTRIMDNATAGVSEDDPDHYRVKVDYAMRLTWHGEFLHASPWAAGAWGNRRISHGCTSMSLDNAGWLFSVTNIGDPIEITGTPLKQNPGNGITVWNISWDDWLKKSGTGGHMTSPEV